MQEQKQEQKKIIKQAQQQKQQVPQEKEIKEEFLIRIAGQDLPGSKNVYVALTRINGVSWSISNAACIKLNIPKLKRVSELTKNEIITIENFLKNPDIKDFLKNRRNDLETGKTGHLISADLEIKKDFDIRRLKKIRSYKGIRHIAKLPVRGQRTRSHFRKKGQVFRVRKKE